MSELGLIALFSWLAGFASFVGGVLAKLEGSAESEAKRELIHGIVALGGGILLAAVAFSLAPQAIESLSPVTLAVTFCCGGVTFCVLDVQIGRRGGSWAQFIAMLTDFVPEALALGALFAHSRHAGILLALFIAAQNLPEGFNAFRESVAGHRSTSATLAVLLATSLLGPLAACSGFFFLQDELQWTAGIMSFASGGILYLVFQDIAPQSKMRRHWTPPLGAVVGFVVGMIGKQILG